MNSGCYNNDISKVLISIEVIDIMSVGKKKFKVKILNFSTEVITYLIIL